MTQKVPYQSNLSWSQFSVEWRHQGSDEPYRWFVESQEDFNTSTSPIAFQWKHKAEEFLKKYLSSVDARIVEVEYVRKETE